MKRLILPAAAVAAALFGCGHAASRATAANQPAAAPTATAAPIPATAPATGPGVRSIVLPTIAFELPDGPGRAVVLDRCVACHTQRYITLQPRFSRDAWTALVQKMRKTFGAPVADEQVDDVVNYLVAVRGKDEPAKQP